MMALLAAALAWALTKATEVRLALRS